MLVPVHERFSARLDRSRWVFLSNWGDNRWEVQLWGPEPLQIAFVGLSLQDAEKQATALVSLALLERSPEVHVPNRLNWRPMGTRPIRAAVGF
jgi:hypothetical protein